MSKRLVDHSTRLANLANLEACVIDHTRITDCLSEVLSGVRHSQSRKVIFVTGPTGVGKSTLKGIADEELNSEFAQLLADDAGAIPVLSMDLMSSEVGSFSWKDFYLRAAIAAHEPFIEYKRPYKGRARLLLPHEIPRDRATWTLRHVYENLLIHRRVKVVLLDEGQHLAKVPSGHRLLDQIDCLKSLADTTGTVHVLFGTYDVMALQEASAQIGRRSRVIHFSAYDRSVAADRESFVRSLKALLELMPLPCDPDVLEAHDHLLQRSVGCIGILKEWLAAAAAEAVARRLATVSLALVLSVGYSDAVVNQMAIEIHNGRRRAMGLAATPPPTLVAGPPAEANGKHKTPRAGRVARRKERHDEVA